VFARKIRVQYASPAGLLPCPLKWLDNFAMRSFTNASAFDDTLPVADGLMEIGTNVGLDGLREAMQNWFRKKSYLSQESELVVVELETSKDSVASKSQ
jgi:hypothetical protein